MLELLDFGDRRIVADGFLKVLADGGHLESADQRAIERLVGTLGGSKRTQGDVDSNRVRFWLGRWSQPPKADEPVLETMFAVEKRYPARCGDREP